jgi:hypothetical protein
VEETETAAGKSESGKDERKDGKRTRQIVAGAAIGIGSAALVAALLYANRGRRNGNRS